MANPIAQESYLLYCENVQDELVKFVELPPNLPRSVALFISLILLATLVVGIYIRHGGILRPLRRKLVYRLTLACIAGWLSASFISPFPVLPVPETSGFFIPGTIFGALVMAPLSNDPRRHPFRVAILVWAATVAYATVWLFGMFVIEVWEKYFPQMASDLAEGPDFLAGAVLSSIVGGPPGITFGVIVGTAMSLALGLRFERSCWLLILIISAICGTIYAGIVLGVWREWVEPVEIHTFRDSAVFLVHIIWYMGLGTAFNLRKPQLLPPSASINHVLLACLCLLTILTCWSLGFQHYPYEWFR